MLPLAISDLPVFLRWRGEPPFGEAQWEQLVSVADRVIVDSSEWSELRYPALAGASSAAIPALVQARAVQWSFELASRWPAIAEQEIAIRGPRAEAELLRGWLALEPPPDRSPARAGRGARGAASTVRRFRSPHEEPRTASNLLSAELDRLSRDRILRGCSFLDKLSLDEGDEPLLGPLRPAEIAE